MKTKIIQITSGRGSAEYCLAVALTMKEMVKEAKDQGIKHEALNKLKGTESGTIVSTTLKFEGDKCEQFCNTWIGTILWVFQSKYRTSQKRKNWFIGVESFDFKNGIEWSEKDISYQTLRGTGPGGQNVNKVETAVRATHIASGVQVKVTDSRSQLQNKKLATERLKEIFMEWQLKSLKGDIQKQRKQHNELKRENPIRTFVKNNSVKVESKKKYDRKRDVKIELD